MLFIYTCSCEVTVLSLHHHQYLHLLTLFFQKVTHHCECSTYRRVHVGIISPIFISTSDMPADLLTKALPRVKVQRFCEMMGLS
ncbi:hypothetical protein L210DRAFT_872015 [Boletus edulis BED1]|uniref:Uncharacterized protein n=1 Tax=Boletus edulis BED1 TaxID=1328754 RepID=A0AAD4GAQ5_BOLED|nr:hypothetical protein L210DRAFT_872015 [Boletus edulis BED1]